MLQIQHLSVRYRGKDALNDICAIVPEGSFVGVIGPNGAGKSTLLKAMLGLVPVSSGQVLFRGRPLVQQRQSVAYVPQRSQVDWDFPTSVWRVASMGRVNTLGCLRWGDRRQRAIVRESLERVEMWSLRHRQIGELSGGQQQRVFLARAIAQDADLFLLDEPLTGVDKTSAVMIRALLEELRSRGKTILACSHEWGHDLNRYDRLLLIDRTLIAHDVPAAVMTQANIQCAFGGTARFGLSESGDVLASLSA